jgi:hypothetical protein
METLFGAPKTNIKKYLRNPCVRQESNLEPSSAVSRSADGYLQQLLSRLAVEFEKAIISIYFTLF